MLTAPRRSVLVVATIVGTFTFASSSAFAADDEAIARLETEIAEERRQRQALEERLANEKHAAEEAEKALPPPILLTGFVQVDWVVHRQSSQDEVSQDGTPLNQDRFLLRRARIRAERDGGLYHAVVELDGNTNNGLQVRPINVEASFKYPPDMPYARTAYALDPSGASKPVGGDCPIPPTRKPLVGYDGPWFMVTAGLFRTPFGFETQEIDFQRPFLERSSMANAIFPDSFDLGLRVAGGYRFARWSFAAMNGDPIGEKAFPGRDPNQSKDLVFRVGGASALTEALRVEGGVSGLTGMGFHKGLAATADTIQWHDANNDGIVNQISEITVIPGQPATPSQNFKRFLVGADLRASYRIPYIGDLDLRAEVMRGQNIDRGFLVSDPVAATRDLRQSGFYVGGTQEITKWAMVGVRYDSYNPDADSRDQKPFSIVPTNASVSTWSFVAAARLGFGKLIAEYDKRSNTLGRDAAGNPTTLADDSFTFRAEVRF